MVGAVLPKAGLGPGPRMPMRTRDMGSASASSRIERRSLGSTENAIISGSIIGVFVIGFIVLIYLHRRNVQKERREDAMDPHKSLDFGLGERVDKGPKAAARRSLMGLGKDPAKHRGGQISMDMNLASPYLLAPDLHTSRDSLARSLQQNEDLYRPATHQAASDAASVFSMPKGRAVSSVYTASVVDRDQFAAKRTSVRKEPPSPLQPVHMRADYKAPENWQDSPTINEKNPFSSPADVSPPSYRSAPYPTEEPAAAVMPRTPSIQEPPTVAQRNVRKSMVALPEIVPGSTLGFDGAAPGIGQAQTSDDIRQQDASGYMPQPESLSMAMPSLPQLSLPQQAGRPEAREPGEFGEQAHHDGEERGRSMHRTSANYQAAGQTGLEIPDKNTHRLSVGLRPLPPDDVVESEDPETRANRIRSFYREYFDESKPDPMPANPGLAIRQHAGAGYNGGHDDSTAGAPYYDPASNSFVMPYAQPVARRAMTPPPSGSRFPGPRPPRAHRGSIGAAGMPGGLPRAGSAASGFGPRPGSSVSNGFGRPRAGSAMSSGHLKGPKRPLPPPAVLTTLPNPSKLRDDSVALLGSIDFAPPDTLKDHAAGRAQSPAGERRPYQLHVPIHSPLVNAFDELAALPSPHLLRKSGTFTGLDFAPPRKFTEADARSETGSIRSNHSGISAVQLSAIRNGAGRVSRLPEDTIFTSAQVQNKLKPSWNMRD